MVEVQTSYNSKFKEGKTTNNLRPSQIGSQSRFNILICAISFSLLSISQQKYKILNNTSKIVVKMSEIKAIEHPTLKVS